MFATVKPRGSAAVKAITNFEMVIITLNSSLTTAAGAEKTITEAEKLLTGVTIGQLEKDAKASKASSDQVLNDAVSINYNTAGRL